MPWRGFSLHPMSMFMQLWYCSSADQLLLVSVMYGLLIGVITMLRGARSPQYLEKCLADGFTYWFLAWFLHALQINGTLQDLIIFSDQREFENDSLKLDQSIGNKFSLFTFKWGGLDTRLLDTCCFLNSELHDFKDLGFPAPSSTYWVCNDLASNKPKVTCATDMWQAVSAFFP